MASLGHTVTLHALAGTGGNDAEIFRYYAVPESFVLRRYRLADRAVPHLLMALRGIGFPTGYVAHLLHGWLALRNAIKGDALLYARNAEWMLTCLRFGNPFIFESHQLPTSQRSWLIQRRLFRHAHFLGLVVISEALRTAYISACPRLPPEKVVVARDGADVVDPNDSKHSPQARFQVGHVGHLYPGRGGDLIIQMARALPQMDFHLVGGRPEDIARLKTMRPSNNLFFHGHRPPSALSDFYRLFDVVLAPYQSKIAVAGGRGDISRWISPMKIFEYMAYSKPIIASNLPVIREFLVPDHTAILVAPEDVTAWVRALHELMAHPTKRQTLAQRAHREFICKYTWRSRTSRILDLFA